MVYHVWPSAIPGGYIGVDIFFVISGYLITAHLMREVTSTGRVVLSRFWARRIRRLLPAAFLVLGASFTLALLVAPGAMLKQNVLEIGAAAVYGLNWLLAANSVDYLAADNAPSLVQHYWSLSVEEQFYILWPLLIVAVLAVARRLKRDQTRSIGITLAIVFVVSLGLSIWWTTSHPSTAYFATPVRAWQFAAGGLLVFLPQARVHSQALFALLSWIALSAVCVAAFSFDSGTAFPGVAALVPVLGSAALIYLGDSSSTWTPQFLAKHGIVQFLGDNSYAIYLWHWPLILAYPAATGRLVGPKSGVLILVATVALAWATQRFIEKPFRSSSGALRTSLRTYSFMATGMVVCLVASLGISQLHTSADERFEATMQRAVAQTGGCFGAYALDNDCASPYILTDTVNPAYSASDIYWERGEGADAPCEVPEVGPKYCVLGEREHPTKTVALIGDSHSHHLWDPFHIAAAQLGWRVIAYQSSGCSGFDVPRSVANADDQSRLDACVAWGDDVRAAVVNDVDIDAAIFSNRAHTKKTNTSAAVKMLKPFEEAGISLTALTDVPGMPNDETKAPTCVETSAETNDPCAWNLTERSNFIVSAVAETSGQIIDLGSRLCTDTRCHAVIGGTIVYMDSNHLTTTFARTLAPWLEEELAASLPRS